MSHRRGLPSGERPATGTARDAAGKPGARAATPARDPTAQVGPRGFGRAGRPSRSGARRRTAGDAVGGARSTPRETARQTRRVCESAPFSLPVVGSALVLAVACWGPARRLPGLPRLKVNNPISCHLVVRRSAAAHGRQHGGPLRSQLGGPVGRSLGVGRSERLQVYFPPTIRPSARGPLRSVGRSPPRLAARGRAGRSWAVWGCKVTTPFPATTTHGRTPPSRTLGLDTGRQGDARRWAAPLRGPECLAGAVPSLRRFQPPQGVSSALLGLRAALTGPPAPDGSGAAEQASEKPAWGLWGGRDRSRRRRGHPLGRQRQNTVLGAVQALA